MSYRYTIGYGKRGVPVYRTNATPLIGVPPIPESAFVGRANRLFAAMIDVEVLGGDFLPAYTVGDNSSVVATDSMKNFIIRKGLEWSGATLESYLRFLGEGFIATYEQLGELRLTGREIPFQQIAVPEGDAFAASEVLFDRVDADASEASIEMVRAEDGPVIRSLTSGQTGLRLMKTTGSAFTSFVRDGFTTLPERRDRPLFITLDVAWCYLDQRDALGNDHGRYVPAEQVRDLIRATFHSFVSESIQHLVHEFGRRLLERFPQLSQISFRAENRTRDPWGERADDSGAHVYSDPFPAFGEIRLTMAR